MHDRRNKALRRCRSAMASISSHALHQRSARFWLKYASTFLARPPAARTAAMSSSSEMPKRCFQ
jgi:hypothetical protein